MNHLKIAGIFILVFILFGCAPQRMYYWGDYSNTLYQSKKNPSDKSVLEHQQALEKILEESQKNNLRVPPGVYAELGYIYFRQNKKDLATKNFTMEKKLYPESTLLMNRLENAVKLAEKPKLPKDNALKSSDKPKSPEDMALELTDKPKSPENNAPKSPDKPQAQDDSAMKTPPANPEKKGEQ